MCRSHLLLSEYDLQHYVRPHIPSLCPPSRDDNPKPPNPRTGLSGRLDIQSLLTMRESALARFLARRRSVQVGSDVSLLAGSISLVVSLSTVPKFFERFSHQEGLQQYGEGCDGRQVQES